MAAEIEKLATGIEAAQEILDGTVVSAGEQQARECVERILGRGNSHSTGR
jgi:hypothetical protein